MNKKAQMAWLDIECLFSYETISQNMINLIISNVCDYGFLVTKPFIAADFNFNVYEQDEYESIENFLSRVNNCSLLTVKFSGKFFDVSAFIVLQFDLDDNVISISISENFIWNYTDDIQKSNIFRLVEFYKFCQHISKAARPSYGTISQEGVNTNYISVENAKNNKVLGFSDKMFDMTEVQALYTWLMKHYGF